MSKNERSSRIALSAAILFTLGAAVSFAESPAIIVKSTTGHVFQNVETGKWSGVFAGRPVLAGKTIVTGADGSVDLTVGKSSIRLDPLSIAQIDPTSSDSGNPTLLIELPAGALRLEIPESAPVAARVKMPFGTLNASQGEVIIDGNRLRAVSGVAKIVNNAGYGCALGAGKVVLAPSQGPFPTPISY